MTLDELWEKSIEIKWMPVHIQGPRIKDWLLRKELVARLDSTMCGYMTSEEFSGSIAHASFMPHKDICQQYINLGLYKKYGDFTDEQMEAMREEREKWIDWWGASPYSAEDSTIFEMNTFNSSYRGCFFNPKTGKVGSTHNVGRWLGNMNELKPEIEWFAKEFPEVELFLTFEDYVENDKDPFCTEPFATIHLKDGNIELVKTRKVKPMRSAIDHSKTYYKLRYFFYKLYSKILYKLDREKYYYNHNYKVLSYFANNKFFSIYELLEICEWWSDEVRVEKGLYYVEKEGL